MSLSSPASSLRTHEDLNEMNPFVCALTLLLSCGSKPASALNISHAAIAFTDTYYTQRSYALCPTLGGCRYVEGNPLTKPFQRNGKAIAFESTYVGLSAAAFVAQKMRTSHSRIFRRLWWLPQSVLLGGSIYGTYSQAKAY
jgi:hypothetical protein